MSKTCLHIHAVFAEDLKMDQEYLVPVLVTGAGGRVGAVGRVASHASGRGTAAGPMGEAVDQSFSQMVPDDIYAVVGYMRSIPPVTFSEPTTIAPPAPASPKQGGATANVAGRKVFEEACASCHDWTGVSRLSPLATIAGTRAVNDPTATNVAQIVISGTTRHEPKGIISMPAFGSTYSDVEIAAVANYVTARFGSAPSNLTGKDVAELRDETAR
jgi:mono/diheme cytochrome c family protein